jgi:hypothetical protein
MPWHKVSGGLIHKRLHINGLEASSVSGKITPKKTGLRKFECMFDSKAVIRGEGNMSTLVVENDVPNDQDVLPSSLSNSPLEKKLRNLIRNKVEFADTPMAPLLGVTRGCSEVQAN